MEDILLWLQVHNQTPHTNHPAACAGTSSGACAEPEGLEARESRMVRIEASVSRTLWGDGGSVASVSGDVRSWNPSAAAGACEEAPAADVGGTCKRTAPSVAAASQRRRFSGFAGVYPWRWGMPVSGRRLAAHSTHAARASRLTHGLLNATNSCTINGPRLHAARDHQEHMANKTPTRQTASCAQDLQGLLQRVCLHRTALWLCVNACVVSPIDACGAARRSSVVCITQRTAHSAGRAAHRLREAAASACRLADAHGAAPHRGERAVQEAVVAGAGLAGRARRGQHGLDGAVPRGGPKHGLHGRVVLVGEAVQPRLHAQQVAALLSPPACMPAA